MTTGALTADLTRLGTVLAVWAHPDDETYLAGRAARPRCATQAQRAVCVTATRGEAANPDAGAGGAGAALARLRSCELEDALAALGVGGASLARPAGRWLRRCGPPAAGLRPHPACSRTYDPTPSSRSGRMATPAIPTTGQSAGGPTSRSARLEAPCLVFLHAVTDRGGRGSTPTSMTTSTSSPWGRPPVCHRARASRPP